MRAFPRRVAAALAFTALLACGGEKPSAPAPAPRAEPAPATATTPPPAAPDPAAAATAAERTAEPPAAPAKPAAKPAPAAAPAPAAPAAPPAAATVPAPGATPPAKPAASAHAKVGSDKCRMCHRVQHQSWSESAHAKKGLDCEGCHGNGGDYWPASVMRDRAKAVAAGLVRPGVDRCKACHPKADASLLPKAHAHKAP